MPSSMPPPSAGAASSFQKDTAEALEREIEALLKRMATLNATMAEARNVGKGGRPLVYCPLLHSPLATRRHDTT